jgi:hypothetical protein
VRKRLLAMVAEGRGFFFLFFFFLTHKRLQDDHLCFSSVIKRVLPL